MSSSSGEKQMTGISGCCVVTRVASDHSLKRKAPPAGLGVCSSSESVAAISPVSSTALETSEGSCKEMTSGRKRLERHRLEMAGRVRIPEDWSQERPLKDWAGCAAAFESFVPEGLDLARDALIQYCRRQANPQRLSLSS